jgi:hemolysin activation/secretion protein
MSRTPLGQEGSDNFLTPYVGLAAERVRDDSILYAAATVSWNTTISTRSRRNAGRPGVDQSFTVLRVQAGHSVYLEPLLNDLGWFNGPDGKGLTSLAHELSLSGRGQFSFDNRLIPTEEEVAGGLFSVRGYPESLAAGDNVFIGSLEYRFHLPNALSPGGRHHGRFDDALVGRPRLRLDAGASSGEPTGTSSSRASSTSPASIGRRNSRAKSPTP